MARSVIDIPDLSIEELDRLMDTAEDIMKMDKESVTTSNSAALET